MRTSLLSIVFTFFVGFSRLYATFSIVAYDPAMREWGIAVATNNIYVGNSTVYIRPGLGAFSVIAETEPGYALHGFELLLRGKSIRESIESTRQADEDESLRQVSGIDSQGNCYAFTGSSWQYQQGVAGQLMGKGYVVMGNQLGAAVLPAMAAAFEATRGTLAERLLAALVAGEKAGGQVTGKQSAALVVKGVNNEWFNDIDLRVDDSKAPFSDLERLLNYHYGRIGLNQAIMAIRNGNITRGRYLLTKSDSLVRGWNGIQGKAVLAHLLLHEDDQAVAIIRAALVQEPKWGVNLPAYDLLRDRAGMEGLIDEKRFTEKDWIGAIDFSAQVQGDAGTGVICEKALKAFPNSAYIHDLYTKAIRSAGKGN